MFNRIISNLCTSSFLNNNHLSKINIMFNLCMLYINMSIFCKFEYQNNIHLHKWYNYLMLCHYTFCRDSHKEHSTKENFRQERNYHYSLLKKCMFLFIYNFSINNFKNLTICICLLSLFYYFRRISTWDTIIWWNIVTCFTRRFARKTCLGRISDYSIIIGAILL
jgi:hypothetical protein